MNLNTKVVLCRDVKPPQYSNNGAGGIDFYIPNDVKWETVTLGPGVSILIPAGVKMELPQGWHLIATPRSSMGKVGLLPGATFIDTDYRGEIHISIINASNQNIVISRGQKIIQYIPVYSPQLNLILSDESELTDTNRGSNGFGSTGKY